MLMYCEEVGGGGNRSSKENEAGGFPPFPAACSPLPLSPFRLGPMLARSTVASGQTSWKLGMGAPKRYQNGRTKQDVRRNHVVKWVLALERVLIRDDVDWQSIIGQPIGHKRARWLCCTVKAKCRITEPWHGSNQKRLTASDVTRRLGQR